MSRCDRDRTVHRRPPAALTFAAVVIVLIVGFVRQVPIAGQTGTSDPPLLAGIVDEAGILTPVISFDGTHWRSRWPEPGDSLDGIALPSSLAAVPRAWTGAPIPHRWPCRGGRCGY